MINAQKSLESRIEIIFPNFKDLEASHNFLYVGKDDISVYLIAINMQKESMGSTSYLVKNESAFKYDDNRLDAAERIYLVKYKEGIWHASLCFGDEIRKMAFPDYEGKVKTLYFKAENLVKTNQPQKQGSPKIFHIINT